MASLERSKHKPTPLVQDAESSSRFLNHAAQVYESALSDMEKIIGRRIFLPDLKINPRPRGRRNYAELEFTKGKVTVLLNPNSEVMKPIAVHELVHIARYARHGELHTGVGMNVEEGFGIVGETGIEAATLGMQDTRSSILKCFQKYELKPDPFTAAETLTSRFHHSHEKESLSSTYGAFNSLPKKRHIHMLEAIRETEKGVDTTQWEDPTVASPRHKVGAGLALLMFMMNDFDAKKTIKAAVDDSMETALTHISLFADKNRDKVAEELRRMRKEFHNPAWDVLFRID